MLRNPTGRESVPAGKSEVQSPVPGQSSGSPDPGTAREGCHSDGGSRRRLGRWSLALSVAAEEWPLDQLIGEIGHQESQGQPAKGTKVRIAQSRNQWLDDRKMPQIQTKRDQTNETEWIELERCANDLVSPYDRQQQ